ncbi:MAG: hypothetical protein MGF17_10130 [Trichodesmium sp. MAG_R04]|nr:hypothetical protein [Trichodesmium sp. MAG_R04]
MLRTYNAVLTRNYLEWTEDTPELSDRPQEVYVTFLEKKPESNQKFRGEKMAKALGKLAKIKAFANVEPKTWQQAVRQDSPITNREN